MATKTLSPAEAAEKYSTDQLVAIQSHTSARAYRYECYMSDYTVESCRRSDVMVDEADAELVALGLNPELIREEFDIPR